jgi:hypothetical protein
MAKQDKPVWNFTPSLTPNFPWTWDASPKKTHVNSARGHLKIQLFQFTTVIQKTFVGLILTEIEQFSRELV